MYRETIESVQKLPIRAITDRKLSKEACEFAGIRVSFDEATGKIDKHYYPITKEGKLVGYKVRNVADKSFYKIGQTRDHDLYGQSLVNGGTVLLICEGEIDHASTWMMAKTKQGTHYNVVSLPDGSDSINAVKRQYEWVDQFKTVILVLDQDSPGKKAAKKIAELFNPGKVKIASFDEKDPNDMLKTGKQKEFMQSIYNAKEYHPDGICDLADCYDDMWKLDKLKGVDWPYQGLNDQLYEIFPGHLYTITSAPGSGKTTLIQELEYYLFQNTEDNIGILHLEQGVGQTSWKIISRHAQMPLHVRKKRQALGVTQQQIDQWWGETIGHRRFKAFKHFGSTESGNIEAKVRYLIKALDCKYIFLDHLSIVVSDQEEGDERKTIDKIMTKLRQIVEETNVTMFLVVHLRRAEGDKGHEHGKEVTMNHLRGSQSIAQLSDVVMATERDQQASTEKLRNLSMLRVVKDRVDGNTGPCCYLAYDKKTTVMSEVPISDYEEHLIEETEF